MARRASQWREAAGIVADSKSAQARKPASELDQINVLGPAA